MPFLPAIPGPYLVPLGPVLTVTLSNIYLEAAHRDHCGGHGTRESGDRPAQARRAQAKATVGRRSLCGFEQLCKAGGYTSGLISLSSAEAQASYEQIEIGAPDGARKANAHHAVPRDKTL